jgi:outer membrane immunogenic protein
MTSRSKNRRRCVGAAAGAALLIMAAVGRAGAADIDDSYLRGPYEPVAERPVNWDGFYLGGQVGYSSMVVDFTKTLDTEELPNQTTDSTTYGGFLGYNWQVDPNLVLGLDFGYTRPSSLSTSTSLNTDTASYRLVDYGTFRGRAGYAFGQFLPYAELGLAVGRIDYTVSSTAASQDNAYALGFVGGLGIDIAILPNVFVRGEWEYAYFTPVKHIASSVNTARVGIGVRF